MPMFKFIFLSSLFIFIGLSCTSEKKETQTQPYDELFVKSSEIYKMAIDSIKNVNDSASFYSVIENLDNKLTKLYYDFPAGTDYSLSEEENDSLIKLSQEFILERNKADRRINVKTETDSIDKTDLKENRTISK